MIARFRSEQYNLHLHRLATCRHTCTSCAVFLAGVSDRLHVLSLSGSYFRTAMRSGEGCRKACQVTPQ